MIEKELRDYLLTNSDIAALVIDGTTGEQRIFPMVSSSTANSDVPAGDVGFGGLPAITFQVITTKRFPRLEGASVLPHPVIQYNCHAGTAFAAIELASLLRKQLDGFQGTLGDTEVDSIDFYDERDGGFELSVHAYRREIDFKVFYSD